MTGHIYSVESLTAQISSALNAHFPLVWVRGEVTNLALPQSGHIYFTLKDASAQLQCVWFSRRQGGAGTTFDPLTGEIYAEPRPHPKEFLRNGLDLVCAGAIEVYAARGQYQLVVEMAEPAGEGLLAMELERRKKLLAAKGYFLPERKRPLPLHASRVALVTSPKGAAIHDFLKVSGDRGLAATIRLFPVLVQGEEAAGQIAAAINEANGQNWAQVIVIIRGGGSLEDLWAFNEEAVCDAIFASRLPVLTGIGHEVDTSLADLTADARAATPSHAAQMLWRPRNELWQNLDGAQMSMDRLMAMKLDGWEKKYAHLNQALGWLSPTRKLEQTRERLKHLTQRLRRELDNLLVSWSERLHRAINARDRAPRLRHSLAMAADTTARLTRELPLAAQRKLLARQRELEALHGKMEMLNPYAPLKRGYALLFTGGKKKRIISSINQVSPQQRIEALVEDGRLDLQVERIEAKSGEQE